MKNICLASHIVSVAHRNLIVSSAIKHFANYMYKKRVTSNIIIDIYQAVVAVVLNAAHCSLFTGKRKSIYIIEECIISLNLNSSCKLGLVLQFHRICQRISTCYYILYIFEDDTLY